MGGAGLTCDSGAADQMSERDIESWGAPEVRVQQDSRSLTQLM